MATAIKELGIDRWPIAERLDLVHTILDGIADEESDSEFTDEQMAELDRRLANPSPTEPWEIVRARILSRKRA